MLSLVLVTSVWRLPTFVWSVPTPVWMVATPLLIEVTVPCSVPTSVVIVAMPFWMLVSTGLIDASEVVTVPRLVLRVAVSFATYPSTASMLLRLVVIDPRLVCTVAMPLLMLEMLELSELTDVVTMPMLVCSVAMLPLIEVTVALSDASEVVIVPVLVWMVTTVPLMLVTLAPMPRMVELRVSSLELIPARVVLRSVFVMIPAAATTAKLPLLVTPKTVVFQVQVPVTASFERVNWPSSSLSGNTCKPPEVTKSAGTRSIAPGVPCGSNMLIVIVGAKVDWMLKLTMSPWLYDEARVLIVKTATPTLNAAVVFKPFASVALIV